MQIVVAETAALGAERRPLIAMCTRAYEEEMALYFEDLGSGLHIWGRVDGQVASHVMLVERWLQAEGRPAPWRTAYVELVATDPTMQGRGYASTLLRHAARLMQDYELAALSPSDEAFYARLGWEMWRGTLSVRTSAGLEPTPGEEVMILRVPRTPATLDLCAPLSVEWRPGEVW